MAFLVLLVLTIPAQAEAPIVADNSNYQDNFLVAKYVPSRDIVPKNSCVLFARWFLKQHGATPERLAQIQGNAGEQQPTHYEPKVLDVVLLREGKDGHEVVVLAIVDDQIFIIEGNWKPNEVTTRQMSITDDRIRGYK